jgi:hypothetical protein
MLVRRRGRRRNPFLKTGGGIALVVVSALVVVCCGGGLILYAAGKGAVDQAASQLATPGQTAAGNVAPQDGVKTVAGGQPVAGLRDGGSELQVTVSSINRAAKSSNRFDTAEKGQFVTVQVDVLAVKGPNDIGPSNFRLISADGTVNLAEFLVAGIDPKLESSTEIQQGQRKSGLVVFDCDPAKLATVKIEFTDDRGRPQAYWTF